LNDFINYLSNVKTQFNATLQEVHSFAPYILPPYALVQLYSESRTENILCGTQDCYDSQGPSYIRMRIEGYQPGHDDPDAIPFNNYWNGHDNYGTTLTTPPDGYIYSGFTNGYILSKKKPGTLPVYVYWNEQRGDMLTVASQEGLDYAHTNNYELVNDTIGYFYTSPPSGPGLKDKKATRWISAISLLETLCPLNTLTNSCNM